MNPLRLLFLGLILALVQIPTRTWALIPQLLGAILIVIACRRLSEDSPEFAGFRWLVLAQIAIALVRILGSEVAWSPGTQSTLIDVAVTVSVFLAIILYLTSIYLVCTGIATLAGRHWLPGLESTALRRWRFYRNTTLLIFAITAFVILTSIWGRGGYSRFRILFIVSVTAGFAAWVAFLELVWHAGTLLKARLTRFRP